MQRASGVPMIPGRPSPVIRAPDRDSNNRPGSVEEASRRGVPPVLYADLERCRHSMEILHEFQNVYDIPVSVVDVGKTTAPAWLRGTPSVVVGTDVYCGDTAFTFLESLSHANSQPGRPEQSSVQDIVSGKGKRGDNKGCGLSDAFCDPPQVSEEEASKKYAGSVDDALAKLMQGRA